MDGCPDLKRVNGFAASPLTNQFKKLTNAYRGLGTGPLMNRRGARATARLARRRPLPR